MKVACIVGTRPDIIKMSPIIKYFEKNHDSTLIHTGQHYDSNMSNIFLDYLKIPFPDHFLNVKSPSEGQQTAKIIAQSEKVLKSERPEIVLVLGDTNSALGVALAAAKMRIPIGHIEAGCRSYDKTMSEEINRVMISHISEYHFAPTINCKSNLLREGIREKDIYLTGHPIVDVIYEIKRRIPKFVQRTTNLRPRKYVFATIHRRENITSRENLTKILSSLNELSQELPVVLPLHPHTLTQIRKFSLSKNLTNVKSIEPVGYIECLGLIKNSKVVITDSGGVQQESALLRTPCITIRDRTEWIETVKLGVNFIVGSRAERIQPAIEKITDNPRLLHENFDKVSTAFGLPGVPMRIMNAIDKNQNLLFKI